MKDLIEKNDAVIHLAGIVGDSCPINPKSAEEVNVDATENIAKFCNDLKKDLFL
jgi:dTDP-4-dehydrorhamnose reductase